MIRFFTKLFTLYSLKNKLQAAFAAFSVIVCLILATFFWFYYKNKEIQQIVSLMSHIQLSIKELYIHQRDFQLYESTNLFFFRTRESKYLAEHQDIVQNLRKKLRNLALDASITSTKAGLSIMELSVRINRVEQYFDSLVKLTLERGFKDFGLEGKMRTSVHSLESSKNIPLTKILGLRRIEKDYFLRKEEKYIYNLQKAIVDIKTNLSPNAQEDLRLLQNYEATFLKIVKLEQQIGLTNQLGLTQVLTQEIYAIEKNISAIRAEVMQLAELRNKQVGYTMLLLLISNIALTITLMILVVRKLSRPIQRLSASIHKVIQDNFAPNSEIILIDKQDEVGKLSVDVRLMLAKIKERDAELTKQNNKLRLSEQTIKRLSEIGQEIIASLHEKKIILDVFHNLNLLLPSTAVAIGMYDSKSHCLWFAGGERGEILYDMDSLENDKLLSVWCFKQQKSIFITDFEQEYKNYLPEVHLPPTIEKRNSFIYLPLSTQENKLGVITVQHTEKNAYTDFHLNILANIATYAAIALQNARTYQQIAQQRQEILEKNELVSQSILYAKNIQDAMLASMSKIKKVLPQSFILFQPKDVVSGDFYYFAELQTPKTDGTTSTRIALAAVDCTGHGIPGAFMSMVGHNLLRGIIVQSQISSPDIVLEKLHRAIKNTFQQNDVISRDGMDIALVIIDQEQKIVEFAGAKNPLLFFSNQEMYEIKGDIHSIGGAVSNENRKYSKHPIKYETGDTFYIFSDGYRDQFGGKEGKKMTSKIFKNLLQHIHTQNLDAQKAYLANYLQQWIQEANEEQLDDILVIGFRLS